MAGNFGHMVNSRRANLKSLSVNNILFFNGALKLRTKCSRLTKRFPIFTLHCFALELLLALK